MKIVNVIASGKIQGNFDIEYLVEILDDVQYEPEQFAGLVYRKPEYTIIMFYSGKISSHGTKSETLSKKAIHDTIDELSKKSGIIGSKNIGQINKSRLISRPFGMVFITFISGSDGSPIPAFSHYFFRLM